MIPTLSSIGYYNRVFGPESTQIDVFTDVKSLVNSVMDGYNVCIFAYGQTGNSFRLYNGFFVWTIEYPS